MSWHIDHPPSADDPEFTSQYARRLGATSPTAGAGAVQIKTSPVLLLHGMNTTNGRMWCRDATNGNLSQSDDWGVTWAHLRGLPTGTSQSTMSSIREFNGYVYMAITKTATSIVGIYRAPIVASGTTLVWEASPVFEFPSTNRTVNVKSTFCAGTQYLFVGTYSVSGAGVDDSRIYRSSNGTTWTECHGDDSGLGVKHVHAVAEDPYNAGHIYATFGDSGSPYFMRKSTDHGSTWTTVLTSIQWQAVQITFSQKWVYLASDRIGSLVFVFDRDTNTAYEATRGYPFQIAVPGAAASTDRFYEIGYWGAVDPATDVYYGSAMDTSTSGNTQGVFRVIQPGAPLELLHSKPTNGIGEFFIGNGYVWTGNWKFPLYQPVPCPK